MTRPQGAVIKIQEKSSTGLRYTLMIGGENVEVVRADVPLVGLRYYEANPRVYSLLRRGQKTVSQNDIERALLKMEHVKVLIQDIRRHGGLIEPIYVKRGTNEVLEGNSRLAAYRTLAEKDPIKWAKIPAILLPESFPDSLTFSLLTQLHIVGKKGWAKYEDAGLLQRRYRVQNIDVPTLASETGLTPRAIKHLINTHEFMTHVEDEDISHWSHYDELLKSRKIRSAMEKYPGLEKTVSDMIKADPTIRAIDIRDRLPIICQGPPRVLKRFSEGVLAFEDAYSKAIDGGADNAALRKLTKARHWLAEADTAQSILNATDSDQEKLCFELDKIRTRTAQLHNMLQRKIKKRE